MKTWRIFSFSGGLIGAIKAPSPSVALELARKKWPQHKQMKTS